jgi:hypothetical protein
MQREQRQFEQKQRFDMHRAEVYRFGAILQTTILPTLDERQRRG